MRIIRRNFSTTTRHNASPYGEIVVATTVGFPTGWTTVVVLSMLLPVYVYFFMRQINSGDIPSEVLQPNNLLFVVGLLSDSLEIGRTLLDLINSNILNTTTLNPQILSSLLPVLHHIINVNELIFDYATPIINIAEQVDSEFINRAEELFEELRSQNNHMASSLRTIEGILDMPLDERLSWFWFEG